jgi:type II secretion system protein G
MKNTLTTSALSLVVCFVGWSQYQLVNGARRASNAIADSFPAVRQDAVNDENILLAKRKLATIADSLELFRKDAGRYPSQDEDLQALIERPTGISMWHPCFNSYDAITDPWGDSYVYVMPGKHNPGGYDLSSMGPDGTPGTAGDIKNWSDK